MLKRHLRIAFDMTPDQYRRRWGLPDGRTELCEEAQQDYEEYRAWYATASDARKGIVAPPSTPKQEVDGADPECRCVRRTWQQTKDLCDSNSSAQGRSDRRLEQLSLGRGGARASIRLPAENRAATQELVNAHNKCCQHRHPEQDGEQLPGASSQPPVAAHGYLFYP
jgi:hypothetical protein